MTSNKDYPPQTPETYREFIPTGEKFNFVSAKTIFPYSERDDVNSETYTQEVFFNGREIWSNKLTYIYGPFGETTIKGEDIGFTTILYSGLYQIKYTYDRNGMVAETGFKNIISYYITAVENHLPLKPWTVTAVINRLLDLAEPLRKGEKPRYRLNGMRADGTIITEDNKSEGEEVGQAAQFDKLLSPQFAFTKQTLRECLQDVGGFIHGEPRLKINKDADGTYYYEVYYDMYAQSDSSDVMYMPFTTKSSKFAIEHYSAWLDTNAENLVNVLDPLSGVITEPYSRGAKTVRTGTVYARITDANMLIPTQFPVYSVEKLEYVYAEGGEVKSVDITPYLFEKSVYDSQLSSYSEAYPYSKAYGIYYSQGAKNIEGLNFKVDAAAFAAYKNYAIVNILRRAMNNENYLADTDENTYPTLAFRITYTPFYNARMAQTKVHYKDFKRPAALIFNQQSNVIESRYYGENLKGAIARLGNVEISLTYTFKWLSQIPKAGQKFDKDHYISAVAVELLPTYIRCTIGLSKDFNRLSRYIGISSVKRYSEISQTQAVERRTLWREFIVVGNEETPDDNTVTGNLMLGLIAQTFKQDADNPVYPTRQISCVTAWGESYKGNTIPAVTLPVISSSYGNSMAFSWEYEDNYSAGAVSQKIDNAIEVGSNKVTGYFQNNSQYTDYYGRLYYYFFDVNTSGQEVTASNLTELGGALPQGGQTYANHNYLYTPPTSPYILRKDNREKLQCNFQLEFVSNLNNLIIGSALSACCPAVRGIDPSLKAKFYVFDTELNKFTDNVEASNPSIDLSKYTAYDVILEWTPLPTAPKQFTVSPAFASSVVPDGVNGKSWAIVTQQTESEEEEVEDEQGNVTTMKKKKGGDLLIGQNITVSAGENFAPIYFTVKREIFDKTVWKNVR